MRLSKVNVGMLVCGSWIAVAAATVVLLAGAVAPAVSPRDDEPPEVDVAEATREIREVATRFYGDLRTPARETALSLMTQEAQEALKVDSTLLKTLPSPSSGAASINVGRPAIDGSRASVPVRVRVGRETHQTQLLLRHVDNRWRVTGIMGTYPTGELAFDFESADAAATASSPLDALKGEPLELAGLTLDGEPLDMSTFAGKVVLVDFWATWCGPCMAEIPNIKEAYERYHELGFDVIAISMDRDLDALTEYMQTQAPPWTVIADRHPANKNSMSQKYGITSIPTFILLDREGKVASLDCRGPKLAAEIERLIGSTP